MAGKMNDCANGLLEASEDLEKSAVSLAENFYDVEAKKLLLDSGKSIMKFMVQLLQLNDLYEIAIILKTIQTVSTQLKARESPQFAYTELSLITRHLCKLLTRRTERCYESKVRVMMEEAEADIAKNIVQLVDVMEELSLNVSNQHLRDKRELLVNDLRELLKKAQKAAKLSAKSPFDLSMLDQEFDFDDFDEEIISPNDIDDGLAQLAKAIENGDDGEAESALRSLKNDLVSQIDNAEERAQNCDDPYLKNKLLDAVNKLKDKLGGLFDELEKGSKDALKMRDPKVIQNLMDQIRALNAQIIDGPGKEQLLQRAANFDVLSPSLVKAVQDGDVRESRAILKDINGELESSADLASCLARNVKDDPYRENRLIQKSSLIKKALPLLEELVNKALSDPNQVPNLKDLLDRLKKALNDLINASLQSTPQEILNNALNFDRALQKPSLLEDEIKKNPLLLSKLVSDIINEGKPLTELAQNYAETRDPDSRKNINADLDRLSKLLRDLIDASKKINKDADPKDFKNLMDVIDKLRKANEDLVNTVIDQPDEELRALHGKNIAATTEIKNAVEKKDLKEVGTSLADLKDNTKKQAFLAKLLYDSFEDEDLKKRLLELSQKFQSDFVNDLLPAIKSALTNPLKIDELNKKLDEIINDSEELIDLSNKVSPEDLLVKNGKVITNTIVSLLKALKEGNSHDLIDKVKELRALVSKQAHLLNVIADSKCSHDKELSNNMKQVANNLEDTYLKIVQMTKEALSNPSSQPKYVALIKDLKENTEKSIELSDLAKKSVEAEKLRMKQELERLEAERRKAEEELKDKDEIYRLGHKITESTQLSSLEDDGSSVSMLIKAADLIGKAMKQLSELSKSNSKKEIIQNARDIANFVNEIQKYALRVSNECSDPILAKEMIDSSKVVKNFAIQMKIVCAVKSSSEENDPTAHKSLVNCAQGLCKNVLNCVNIAKIAKLKKKLN